jgi:hypothetical protein
MEQSMLPVLPLRQEERLASEIAPRKNRSAPDRSGDIGNVYAEGSFLA